MKYKAAVFDMDGTILDTSQDLVDAVNYAMAECGHRHDFTKNHGCLFFGSGVLVALQRAIALERGMERDEILKIGTEELPRLPGLKEEELEKLKSIYVPFYNKNNAVHTCAFPGIKELLMKLKEAGVKTAVVSNKPDEFVGVLAEKYFRGLFDAAIGESPRVRRKPAPDMNKLILDRFGISAADAVYIGDTEIDIETARNSGMDCIMADWGFRSREELLALDPGLPVVSDAADIYSLVMG